MSVLCKFNGIWKKVGENIIRHSEPVGIIRMHCGTVAPDGYMLCHGQTLNRSEYSDLYDVIGTKFGTGDGSTGSFNLPNLQNRTTFGVGTATGSLRSIGASTVGSLPNVTGYILSDARFWGQGRTTAIGSYTEQNGALTMNHNLHNSSSQGYNEDSSATVWPGHGQDVMNVLTVNASRSSSMYKTTAQAVPASVGVEYIIKVIL